MSGAAGAFPLVDALYRRAHRGMALGLDPTRAALAELGDPHAALRAVHVAGTNGKGSVSAMVEAIARAAGLRTGLFTSPHLCRYAERIRIDGEPIADAPFARALERVLGARAPLTFFESLTVAAFVAFRDAVVDVAVLEVGLGGRLDSTNVIESPLVTAVTSIALDHTDLLGGTLDAIAREKAGIFKPRSPVVLGPLDPAADAAIEEIAERVGAGPRWRVRRAAPPRTAGAPDGVEERARGEPSAGGAVTLSERDGAIEIMPPRGFDAARVAGPVGLAGPHQADNAAVACAIAWRLFERLPAPPLSRDAQTRAITRGLASVRWPGRLERIEHDGRAVLLDCAHNAHGAEALSRALAAQGLGPDRVVLVFGALADKPWADMLAVLAPRAARRVYTAPKGRAPAPLEALVALAPGEPVPDPAAALSRAFAMSRPGDVVLVTGSSYLVGELHGALLGIACDPPVAL